MEKTTICDTTVAAAAPSTPIPSPNPPYLSRLKINIGSRITFNTVPIAATITGNFMSPSPAKIERNTIEKMMNVIP